MRHKLSNEIQDVIVRCSTTLVDHHLEFGIYHSEVEDVALSSKVEEYIQRLGPYNHNLVSIFVHLLVFGKVIVQFRNQSHRLQLKAASDLMTRTKATVLFDRIREDVMGKMNFSEGPGGVTQRIVVEEPTVILPTKKIKFFT